MPEVRRVARVLLVDHFERLLLLHFRIHGGPEVWIPPGGGAEPGEDLEEAALREVREETSVALDGPLAGAWMNRTHYFGRDVEETYFLARLTSTPEVALDAAPNGKADLLEYRWWTAEELVAAEAARPDLEFMPPRIGDLLRSLIEHGSPSMPAQLGE